MNGFQCDPGTENGFVDSLEIDNLLGPLGLGELLSWIGTSSAGGKRAHGVVDLGAYCDLVRCLQLPFYEEARPFFGPATRSWLATHDSSPDHPSTLKTIATKGHFDQ